MKQPELDILLTLSARDNQGYGIYRQIRADALGLTGIYAGAIYREVPRLHDRSLIEVVDSPHKPLKYRLTAAVDDH